MKKNYYLILSVIIAIMPSLKLFGGNKHPKPKVESAPTHQSSPFIDSDDDDYTPPPRRRRAPILAQEKPDERIQELQAKVDELKNTVAGVIDQALKRGQQLDSLAAKTNKLKDAAKTFKSDTQKAKEEAKIGFSGPLNDIFNGASFTLITIFYGTLLYDEYMSLQNDEVKDKTGFARFVLRRFCEFKWSLTEAARIAWIAIIAKIMFDYYG